MKKEKFLIIVGGNRCGTTSLFNYLSPHPEIVPSLEKETRFFLDDDYPIARRSTKPFNNSLETYLSFFSDQSPNKWHLEGSPDYLYSPGSAERLYQFFENHELMLIVLLRDPISRFVSWFHYDKQIGNIPLKTSFKDYLNANCRTPTSNAFNRLETGNYSKYVSRYKRMFGERLLLYSFEYLTTRPESLLHDISLRLDINPSLDISNVVPHNQSRKVKNARLNSVYNFIRRNLKNRVPQRGILHDCIKRLAYTYNKVNYKSLNKHTLNDNERKILSEYYRGEVEWIRRNVLYIK